MMNLMKIFLDQYKSYNEIQLVSEKDETEQAVLYGHIRAIEAIQNFIVYQEENE